ncbi:hypothetical protein YDYSY3_60050 [Paenibacillus chitinolyticus]|nr:hypothetical protein YDYSY3_60050 [Paenibacillus chitinolyticus]
MGDVRLTDAYHTNQNTREFTTKLHNRPHLFHLLYVYIVGMNGSKLRIIDHKTHGRHKEEATKAGASTLANLHLTGPFT